MESRGMLIGLSTFLFVSAAHGQSGSTPINASDPYGATYADCETLPKTLRDRNGCPYDLPEDLSTGFLYDDAASDSNFINGDLVSNIQRFEGDIMVESVAGSVQGAKQSVIGGMDPSRKWNNGIIPYVIDAGYNDADAAVIKKGFCKFQQASCVRFVPRTNQTDFLKMKSYANQGCASFIGKRGKKQITRFQSPQCTSEAAVVQHEMMHVLGFEHEQSRVDRDNHINIIYANIAPGMERNFKKYHQLSYDDFGQAYDFVSIMHYPSATFASNLSNPTLTKKDGSIIARPTGFSTLDVVRIRAAYNCGGDGVSRSDDSQFDLTCTDPNRGIDSDQPDPPA